MMSMIFINELGLAELAAGVGWDAALYSNLSFSVGSISFYALETLFA